MSNSVRSNPFQEFYSSFYILQFYNFTISNSQVISIETKLLHAINQFACDQLRLKINYSDEQ